MVYEAFPIANFKTGLYHARHPWMSPSDAFTESNNAFTRRGVVTKRRGYTELGQMSHMVGTAITGITQANPAVVTTSTAHGLSNGASHWLYDVVGMTEVNGNTYTTANVTANTFELSGVDSTAFTAYTSGGKVGEFTTNAITGLKEFRKSDGTLELLAFDTKRVAKFDTGTEEFEDITEADVFTGDNEDFFWFTNWKNVAYMTNNVDRIMSWDGTTFDSTFDVDIDGNASNDVDTCLMILPYHERLILLCPTENSVVKPHRARWSSIDDPSVWDDTITSGGGFVDAPTDEWIVSASFIKDQLIVFFQHSVWRLRFTGDIDLPFVWELIDNTKKIDSTHAVVSNLSETFAYGVTGFVGTDGFQTYLLDPSVPDLSLDVNISKTSIFASQKYERSDQIWMSCPEIGSLSSDKVLVFNPEEKNWAKFDLSLTVMGLTETLSTVTWDKESRTWDDISETWNDFGNQAGYPVLLGGDQNGIIRRLDDTNDDDGADIAFEYKSSRLNPYWDKGKRAKLGWIDFLVTTDDSTELSVDFYIDFDETPYQTLTLDFSGDNSDQVKIWKRLDSGAIGSSHRLRLYHTASNQPVEIHAMVLNFQPAGDIHG